MRKFLSVVESKNFELERDNVSSDIRRMDEILDGVYWVLGRDPSSGEQVSAKNMWAIVTKPELFTAI